MGPQNRGTPIQQIWKTHTAPVKTGWLRLDTLAQGNTQWMMERQAQAASLKSCQGLSRSWLSPKSQARRTAKPPTKMMTAIQSAGPVRNS